MARRFDSIEKTHRLISHSALFERLEPRQLLAADLVATFASAVPTALLPAGNQLSVRITNIGDVPAIGTVDTTLTFNNVADPSTTTFLTPAHATIKIKLAPLKSQIVKLKFDPPTGLPEGTYSMAATVNHNNTLLEADTTNNASAPVTILIHPPS